MSAKSERLVLIGSSRTKNNELVSVENVLRTLNKSTSYCICDATSPDFFPGRKLPSDWVRDLENGPWCFFPLNFLDEPYYGGSFLEEYRKFPMSYSTGFASRDGALEACKTWLNKQWLRNIQMVDWETYQLLNEAFIEQNKNIDDQLSEALEPFCFCGSAYDCGCC